MMRRLSPRCAVVMLAPSLMILAGCIGGKTTPSRFYVLSSLPSPEAEKQVTTAEHGVAIGVGPVTIPPYLDRPEIVTRASGTELHLAEFDRWAEPLQQNFSRVLAENLSILIPTDRAAMFPWEQSTPIDYRVAVEVTRFEGNADGDSSLMARWNIVGADGKKELLARQSSFSARADAQDYEARVSALSRTIADLSREIATAIKALSPKAPDK
ncbi:MAG: membrane integrity-associated transporter subunit PqiC [Candidatus Methylomirabilales bacterium]